MTLKKPACQSSVPQHPRRADGDDFRRVWATSLVVSVFATPPLLALAGLPLAYHIYHERPALKVGLMTVAFSIAILVVSWVVPIVARGI